MGRSGIISAVGMAIESVFRTVPLTGSGNPYSIGISGSNPLRYCIVDPSEGIQGDPEIDTGKEVDGDVQVRRLTRTGKLYQGSLTFKVDPENLYYFMLGILGRDIQATVQAADSTHSPAVLSHTMLPGKYAPSFTVEEDISDGTFGRLSSGVVVTKLELTFGKVLTAKVTLYGHRQIPNDYPTAAGIFTTYAFGSNPGLLPVQMGGDGTKQTVRTASPTYVDVAQGQSGNGPLTFASMELAFGTAGGFSANRILINGAPVNIEILEGTTVVFEREVDSRLSGGSGFDRGSVTGNKFMVSGKLVALYEDMTLPASALEFAQIGMDLLFVGPPIGTSGQNYSLEVFLPHMKLSKAPVGETAETIVINSEYETKKDASLGYAVQVNLVNTVDNTSLSGQYIASCVTTAVITNNTSDEIQVNTSAGFSVGDSVTIVGATENPYIVTSIPDSTHLVFGAGLVQAHNGSVPIGSSVLEATSTYGPGGLGGWQNS